MNDDLITSAYKMGYDHGTSAASWVTDGNTSEPTYRQLAQGLADGDPEVLDSLPSAPLSGEWADDPTPSSVLADLEVDPADDGADDLLWSYEEGFSSGVTDEITRVCRHHLGDDCPI
jgi:hypothetical protein